MKKKLIKKCQSGGRQYHYGRFPEGHENEYKLYGTDKYATAGDNVLADENNKMVTKNNTQAYLDYLAANNIPIEGPTLNNINVYYNKKDNNTSTSLGEDFEDRLKRLQQDPVANDEQIKQLWLEQGEQQWNQTHDKHEIDTRAADKIANTKTPEALSIMSPAIIGLAAILGFESATAMAAWAAAYPGTLIGIGSYMWNTSPRTMAINIADEVPKDSYNDTSKLTKFLKDNYNVTLDDYEVEDIINQKTQDKKRLTLISHLNSYIRYKDK